MFDQAERLEELRQFRPAIYRALPTSDDRRPASAEATADKPTSGKPELSSRASGSSGPRTSDVGRR
jgi:hypothetical protein